MKNLLKNNHFLLILIGLALMFLSSGLAIVSVPVAATAGVLGIISAIGALVGQQLDHKRN
jgi:succinate-acetate transporter protein